MYVIRITVLFKKIPIGQSFFIYIYQQILAHLCMTSDVTVRVNQSPNTSSHLNYPASQHQVSIQTKRQAFTTASPLQ